MKLDKKRYSITKHGEKYCLFDTEQSGKITPHKYVGYLTKNSNDYYLPTGDKVTNLEQQLTEYKQSLPYNIEYYCPLYRNGLFEELVINNWLKENNFKNQYDNNYSLTISNLITGITSFNFTFENMDACGYGKNIKILVWESDYSWTEFECNRSPEDFIQTMLSILNVFVYTQIASLIKLTSETVSFDKISMTTIEVTNTLDVVKTDFRQELKQKLQQIIDNL